MNHDAFERLSAYADGELDNARRVAIEAELAGDPSLRAILAYIRSTQSSLRQAYVHTYHSDVPDRLMATLSATPPAAPSAGFRSRTWRLPTFAAFSSTAAASAFAGWLIAGLLAAAPAETLMVASADGLTAGPQLARFLDESLSGVPADVLGAATQVQLSFAAPDGEACRQFQAGQTAALACKAPGGDWRIEASSTTLASAEAGYELAAGTSPAAIETAISGKGAIQILDAEGERAAIDAGWRR